MATRLDRRLRAGPLPAAFVLAALVASAAWALTTTSTATFTATSGTQNWSAYGTLSYTSATNQEMHFVQYDPGTDANHPHAVTVTLTPGAGYINATVYYRAVIYDTPSCPNI